MLVTSTGRFHVVDEGEGSTLVFVHGFPLSHAMWKHQPAEFSRTHRVIIPDLRGFGQSTATTPIASLSDHADDLAQLLDQLQIQEPIVLCGLSMGGYIAFRFLEKYPARLRGLILCDTKATPDTPEAAQNRRNMADQVLEQGSQIIVDAMLPKLFSSETQKSQPQIIDETRRVMKSTAPEAIAAAQRAMAARPDSTPQLARISVPTLVVVGESDALATPAEMAAMAAAIPGAKFEQIPLAGHLAPLEQPAVVNAVMRTYLDSLSN
ncbi:MAG: alpha/beta fold hydrolase [Planctomycetaceae bacterium]